jgi:TPR repeat protein
MRWTPDVFGRKSFLTHGNRFEHPGAAQRRVHHCAQPVPGTCLEFRRPRAWACDIEERGSDPLAPEGGWARTYFLGFSYISGKGVPQDYIQAGVWFRRAAFQGDADAQFSFRLLNAEGAGVPQSFAEAYFWLDVAAAGLKGDQEQAAAKERDETAAKLKPQELLSIQKRAEKWFASHPPQ